MNAGRLLSTEYVAWKGRHCAFDQSSFEHFMDYVFAQVMGQALPAPDPWDPNIDFSVIGKRSLYHKRDTHLSISPSPPLQRRQKEAGSLTNSCSSTEETDPSPQQSTGVHPSNLSRIPSPWPNGRSLRRDLACSTRARRKATTSRSASVRSRRLSTARTCRNCCRPEGRYPRQSVTSRRKRPRNATRLRHSNLWQYFAVSMLQTVWSDKFSAVYWKEKHLWFPKCYLSNALMWSSYLLNY